MGRLHGNAAERAPHHLMVVGSKSHTFEYFSLLRVQWEMVCCLSICSKSNSCVIWTFFSPKGTWWRLPRQPKRLNRQFNSLMSSNSLYHIPHNQFYLFSMLFQPFQAAGPTIVVLRQWFWGILANFHPYWCLVGGTMTTWGTPYRVITLSQCNTWILEPIIKRTCVTKVGNSGNCLLYTSPSPRD